MPVAVNWYIEQMVHKKADGGVIQANWRCVGKNDSGPESSSVADQALFTYDASSPDFTPYADLTQDQVLQWVWAELGDSRKAEIEAQVVYAVDQKIAYNNADGTGLPWEADEAASGSGTTDAVD